MKIGITLKPLYAEVKEGEEYYGVISRFKRVWEVVKYNEWSGEFVKQWRTTVKVNLAFVIFTFDWYTAGSKSKSGKYNMPL